MAGLGLVARKCGMTRYFTPEGVSIPVTVALIENNNRVTQIKTLANDGYCAVQVTTGTQLASRVNKPMAGHYAKAGVEAGDGLWEFALSEKELEGISLGQELKADHFKIGQIVDIVGTTKGKGFAGGIKRHHFKSQPQTHGTSLAHRALGSTGMNQSPGRVFPGKKMAGQLGNVRRTLQNQKVVHIDMERSLLFIKGVAPGATNGHIMILPSVKGEK